MMVGNHLTIINSNQRLLFIKTMISIAAWYTVGQYYHFWFLHILPSFHGAQEYYLADDLSMVYLCVSCVFVTNN